ncbi:hypothetical protein [Undibacterium pigrum]|uniref:Uncharacterized protein n=1 Tax=Undibacterium pigrum TaxID=401470 RepID=A0A318K0Z3_9BURK|nr:hypothetical protein [Undibacterium pigrum]PXX46964.1 hypothetical protein DFR42_101540 [Undibacterium pigrum]
MSKSNFMLVPHDIPPEIVECPQTFPDVDLYPAITFKASRSKVAKDCGVVKQKDELGICSVAQFRVIHTLVMLYQSAFDPKDHWTVFVDMHECVGSKQVPTLLGASVVRYLTGGDVKPDWLNEDADSVYRSRLRKLSLIGETIVMSGVTTKNKSSPLTIRTTRPLREPTFQISMFGKEPKSLPGRKLAAANAAKKGKEKVATPVKIAANKSMVSAPKMAAAKAAAPRKAPLSKK